MSWCCRYNNFIYCYVKFGSGMDNQSSLVFNIISILALLYLLINKTHCFCTFNICSPGYPYKTPLHLKKSTPRISCLKYSQYPATSKVIMLGDTNRQAQDTLDAFSFLGRKNRLNLVRPRYNNFIWNQEAESNLLVQKWSKIHKIWLRLSKLLVKGIVQRQNS